MCLKLLSSFYKWGNWDTVQSSKWSKFTELARYCLDLNPGHLMSSPWSKQHTLLPPLRWDAYYRQIQVSSWLICIIKVRFLDKFYHWPSLSYIALQLLILSQLSLTWQITLSRITLWNDKLKWYIILEILVLENV